MKPNIVALCLAIQLACVQPAEAGVRRFLFKVITAPVRYPVAVVDSVAESASVWLMYGEWK